MADRALSFDTVKVRGGYNPEDHNDAVSVPIYQTASFNLGSTERAKRIFAFEEDAFLYTRIGNPTVSVLEQRVSALDGAAAAVAVGSGMAALTYALLNVAEGGGRILTSLRLYGGTFDSFFKIYPNFGVAIDEFPNPDDPQSIKDAIKPDTKAIFIESISNPNAAVSDINALAQIAHEHGIPLIVDNTVATPYLLNPIKYGADIVVYSATKALNGHGNTIAGLILENGKFNWANGKFPQFTKPYYSLHDKQGRSRSFAEVFPDKPFTARVRANYLAYFGASLSPFDAYLTLTGLETLSERVKKQVESTEKIVRYLESSDKVAWVKHPSAKSSSYRELAEKYLPKGAGSILTFGIAGTDEQIDRVLDAVKLFSYHSNIGDARSLITNSPKTTHVELTPEQQLAADIPLNTIRLSIGLEDVDDLISDLKQAFQKAFE